MTTSILFRRGTASQWTTQNPILKAGEPGVETDTGKIKFGDGVTVWSGLTYSTTDRSTIPTQVYNTAEGGTNGTTVSTTNSGGLSGTAFDNVNIGAGATLTFDTTNAQGLLSYNFDPVANLTDYVEWSTAIGTLTEFYGRFYLYSPSPAATVTVARFMNGSGTQSCGLRFTTTRKLQILDTANTVVGALNTAFTANTWVRVEFHFVNSATVGFMEYKLFNDPTSRVATESLAVSGLNTESQTTLYRFGNTLTPNVDLASFWLDNIAIVTDGYPGTDTIPTKGAMGHEGLGSDLPSDVQLFTTSGANTWSKPSNARRVQILAVGGGGGGGSGGTNTTTNTAAGGGGGGGGQIQKAKYRSSDLAQTLTLSVGAAGAIAGNGGDSTVTNAGAVILTAKGGTGGVTAVTTTAGAGGAGGTRGTATTAPTGATGLVGGGGGAVGAPGAVGASADFGGAGGGGGSNGANVGGTGGGATLESAAGGGGGAAVVSSTAQNGGPGGASSAAGGAIAGPSGSTGNTGSKPTTPSPATSTLAPYGGAGGGGGGSGRATGGGDGGVGGSYGGGGGAGGGANNSGAAGVGGIGAVGAILIITWF